MSYYFEVEIKDYPDGESWFDNDAFYIDSNISNIRYSLYGLNGWPGLQSYEEGGNYMEFTIGGPNFIKFVEDDDEEFQEFFQEFVEGIKRSKSPEKVIISITVEVP